MSSGNLEEILQNLETHEYTFRTSLLSDKSIEVSFRPMKTKDQKVLLVNTENETYVNQLKGLAELIKSCIKKSKIKVEELFIQDFVWLVLNIRMRSLGESLDITGICTECSKRTPNLKIDLEKNIIAKYSSGLKNNIVAVTPDLKMVLTFPKVKHLLSKKSDAPVLDLIADGIDYVEFKDKVVDLTSEEKIDLLDKIDIKFITQFEKFEAENDFGVIIKFDFKCTHCGADNKIEVKENILSFF